MGDLSVRPPAVAGAFYEADPGRLRSQLEWCFDHPVGPRARPRPWGRRRVVGLVAPHAGLMYSGPVAAHAYLHLAESVAPEVIVIVGPDHYGLGSPVAVAPHSAWRTPLGQVNTDHPAKAALAERGLALDGRGHAHEHSVEVQLPFLQYLGYRGCVLPIVMAVQDRQTVRRLADALAAAGAGLAVTLVASTDLSHYLPHQRAVAADRPILNALAAGDSEGLLETVAGRGLTMCGAGPAAAVLEACRRLGATSFHVLRYATSGDTGGGHDSVVGYAAATAEVV
ncbi:MAG: AmmeMemoRadiSam system protein B [Armatimonadota bacterium]|nr:AmmeMemoRadiSam system protein B [Armatimonadota bacterium]MDR7543138.1 AmmeMemoRadiSam system protein B [Armatimonadota bacterium]